MIFIVIILSKLLVLIQFTKLLVFYLICYYSIQALRYLQKIVEHKTVQMLSILQTSKKSVRFDFLTLLIFVLIVVLFRFVGEVFGKTAFAGFAVLLT